MNDEEFLKYFEGINDDQVKGIPKSEKHCFLLLLGNGFDLQCGLRTKYNDFFEYSLNEVRDDDHIYQMVQDELHKMESDGNYKLTNIEQLYKKHDKYLSVWDIYFIQSNAHCVNWADVEKLMKKSLVNDKFWDGVLIYFRQLISGEHSDNIVEEYTNGLQGLLALLIYERYFTIDGKFLGKDPGTDDDEIFYKKLVIDLKVFEQRFGDYINEQYELNKEEYTQVSRDNIVNIYQDAIGRFGFSSKDCLLRIVSFNYLPLLDENLNEDRKYIHYLHSDLYNPIFCIDKIDDDYDRRTNNDRSIVYYNFFSNEKREVDLGVYSIDKIYPTEKIDHFIILSYGLSFSDVDIDDFARLIGPEVIDDRYKINTKIRSFRNMIAYYRDVGNTKKEDIQKTRENKIDTTDNLRNLVEKMDANTPFTSLVDGPNKKIRVCPIKLKSIKNKT